MLHEDLLTWTWSLLGLWSRTYHRSALANNVLCCYSITDFFAFIDNTFSFSVYLCAGQRASPLTSSRRKSNAACYGRLGLGREELGHMTHDAVLNERLIINASFVQPSPQTTTIPSIGAVQPRATTSPRSKWKNSEYLALAFTYRPDRWGVHCEGCMPLSEVLPYLRAMPHMWSPWLWSPS